jgi:1-acyl-sn-glycerol-3-phosphate acyltransferase
MIGVASALLIVGMTLLFPSRRAHIRWRSFIFRMWSRATAALFKIRITTLGVPPRAPFFLVANHLSYADIIVLASQVDCSFIAKQDVATWPLIGLLCRSVGTIFIDRNNRRDITRVNAQVEQALAEGRGVVLFPEGTSSQGATVLPFKSGLLELPARARLAVSYAALSYGVGDRETPAHVSVCWWGDMTFMRHLAGLLHLSEINATLTFGRETIRGGDRKALASQLHAAVKQEFIPVIKPEEEWSAVNR